MRELSADEESALDALAEIDPDAAEVIRDCWARLSDEGRERFVRFAERLAKIPGEIDPTDAQLKTMIETDSDFPHH